MNKAPEGITIFFNTGDAVADRSGLLLYQPSRLDRYWRTKQMFYRALAFAGWRARAGAPRVARQPETDIILFLPDGEVEVEGDLLDLALTTLNEALDQC